MVPWCREACLGWDRPVVVRQPRVLGRVLARTACTDGAHHSQAQVLPAPRPARHMTQAHFLCSAGLDSCWERSRERGYEVGDCQGSQGSQNSRSVTENSSQTSRENWATQALLEFSTEFSVAENSYQHCQNSATGGFSETPVAFSLDPRSSKLAPRNIPHTRRTNPAPSASPAPASPYRPSTCEGKEGREVGREGMGGA